VTFRQERKEEDQIPFGYGIAYADLKRDVWVLYPIPMNLIVRALTVVHDHLRKPLWGQESYHALAKSNLKLVNELAEHRKTIRQKSMEIELKTQRLLCLEQDLIDLDVQLKAFTKKGQKSGPNKSSGP
jgi:hypothetical protein